MPVLTVQIFEETDRDWRVAKVYIVMVVLFLTTLLQKYLEKDNIDRAKKTIVHCFRLLLLAIQILESGSVVNFHAAYKYTKLMENITEKEWSFYEGKFGTEFKAMRDRITQLVSQSSPFAKK